MDVCIIARALTRRPTSFSFVPTTTMTESMIDNEKENDEDPIVFRSRLALDL
jgi:hypothetical protein